MATHSSILAWRIPWTEEPGGLQSIGSQRVKHNCLTNTLTFKADEMPNVFPRSIQFAKLSGQIMFRILRYF